MNARSRTIVGATAIICSAIYFASDVVELWTGGFSTAQLALTYIGEAAIPLFVIGLYAVQRPSIGALVRTVAAGVRDLAFASMGFAVLTRPESSPWGSQEARRPIRTRTAASLRT